MGILGKVTGSVVHFYIGWKIFMLAIAFVALLWFVVVSGVFEEEDHYCLKNQECYTFEVYFENPFGADYVQEIDYDKLPHKKAFLYDKTRSRKVGTSWFEYNHKAIFMVPKGLYLLTTDNEEFTEQSFFIDNDKAIEISNEETLLEKDK